MPCVVVKKTQRCRAERMRGISRKWTLWVGVSMDAVGLVLAHWRKISGRPRVLPCLHPWQTFVRASSSSAYTQTSNDSVVTAYHAGCSLAWLYCAVPLLSPSMRGVTWCEKVVGVNYQKNICHISGFRALVGRYCGRGDAFKPRTCLAAC